MVSGQGKKQESIQIQTPQESVDGSWPCGLGGGSHEASASPPRENNQSQEGSRGWVQRKVVPTGRSQEKPLVTAEEMRGQLALGRTRGTQDQRHSKWRMQKGSEFTHISVSSLPVTPHCPGCNQDISDEVKFKNIFPPLNAVAVKDTKVSTLPDSPALGGKMPHLHSSYL